MKLFNELYDADEEIYLKNREKDFLVKNDGTWHGISDDKCGSCLWNSDIRYPLKCKCGGLIHKEQDSEECACDQCDQKFEEKQ